MSPTAGPLPMMIWGFVLAAAVLLVGIVVWAFLEQKPSAGREATRTALATLASTFLGVGLAILATADHEHAQTVRRLCSIGDVALAEIDDSAYRISPHPDEDKRAQGEGRRLVLERPARALAILLEDPAFLEAGEPSAVSQLLSLSTMLQWNPVPPGNTYPVPAPIPEVDTVRENLRKASEVLREQLFRICGR